MTERLAGYQSTSAQQRSRQEVPDGAGGCFQKAARTAAKNHRPAARQPGSRMHTVRKGETLWSISQHYGISLKQLLAANPQFDPGSADSMHHYAGVRSADGREAKKDADDIMPGQGISLPPEAKAPEPAKPKGSNFAESAPGKRQTGGGDPAPASGGRHRQGQSGQRSPAPVTGPVIGGGYPSPLDGRSHLDPVGKEMRQWGPAGPSRKGQQGLKEIEPYLPWWARTYDVGVTYEEKDGNPLLAGGAKVLLSAVKRLEKGDVIRGEKPLPSGQLPKNPLRNLTSANPMAAGVNKVVRQIEALGNAKPVEVDGKVNTSRAVIFSKVYGVGSLITNGLDLRVAIAEGQGHSIVSNSLELVRAGSDTYKGFRPTSSWAAGPLKIAADRISGATYVAQGLLEMDQAYEDYKHGRQSKQDAAACVFDGLFSSSMGVMQYIPVTAPVAYTVNTSIGVVEGGAAMTGNKVDVGRSLYKGVRHLPTLALMGSSPLALPMLMRNPQSLQKIDEVGANLVDNAVLGLGKAVNYVGDGIRWMFSD